MTIDHEHDVEPVAPQPKLTPIEAPRPATPTKIEQVIKRMSASYIADVQALREELSQHVQTAERERAPLAALPGERAQQQNTQQTQKANTSAGVPDPEVPLPHSAPAPPARSALSLFARWLKQNRSPNGTSNGRYPHGNEHLIEMRQIVKIYESAAGPFTALKGVSLQVAAGEFVAVVGKSGSGKSTLLNIIAGIDRPTSGEVRVSGTAVHTLNERHVAPWRGRTVGIIFQFFQLLPTLTAIENVMLPMDFCHMYAPHERQERALHLLEQVDLVEHAHKLPTALSGGQQQRVAIARALANDPPILLADEPTGNLDSQTAEVVFRLFMDLVANGKTIVMVTHDPDLTKWIPRAVILGDGEILDEVVHEQSGPLSIPDWQSQEEPG